MKTTVFVSSWYRHWAKAFREFFSTSIQWACLPTLHSWGYCVILYVHTCKQHKQKLNTNMVDSKLHDLISLLFTKEHVILETHNVSVSNGFNKQLFVGSPEFKLANKYRKAVAQNLSFIQFLLFLNFRSKSVLPIYVAYILITWGQLEEHGLQSCKDLSVTLNSAISLLCDLGKSLNFETLLPLFYTKHNKNADLI